MNNSVIAGFYMSSQRLLYFSGSAHYGSGTLSLATQQDLIWVNGSSLSYTNGIAYGAVIGNTSLANFNFMGNDIYSEPMKGYIKFIGIWTNNLSSVNASNLAAWSAIH
jgi:hypothetical protein